MIEFENYKKFLRKNKSFHPNVSFEIKSLALTEFKYVKGLMIYVHELIIDTKEEIDITDTISKVDFIKIERLKFEATSYIHQLLKKIKFDYLINNDWQNGEHFNHYNIDGCWD